MKLQIALFLLLSTCSQSESRILGLRKNQKKKTQHKHVAAESRIVGGTTATQGDYPFFVEWDGCGASLIHEDIILTAAHCNGISSNTVLIGAHQSNSDQDGAEFRTIVERRPHPAYDAFTVANDFQVMKLNQASSKTPVLINAEVGIPYDNEELTVMGFGALSEGDFYGSTILQEVTVNAVPHETCNAQYSGEIVEDVMLCAGIPGGGKDSCQGDSGGPIIDTSGVQVGIVSWGYGCGRPEFSGVYSRISGAIDWINGQICELSDNPPESCGATGNPNPGNPPATGSVQVQYNIHFDDYPQEAGLLIRSVGGDVIVNYPIGSFASTPGLFTETLTLSPGDYQLELMDSFGDGLCCDFGQGRFEIHALLSSSEGDVIVLAEGDATFADSKLVEFSVPSVSSCQDDQSGSFLVDSEVGNSDCAWLGTNLDRYGYLCQFLDVAAICPGTCDACDYFE